MNLNLKNSPESELRQSRTIGDGEEENSSDDDISTTLSTCKPSLFTKQPKRQWPWLIENRLEDEEDGEEDKPEETSNNTE